MARKKSTSSKKPALPQSPWPTRIAWAGFAASLVLCVFRVALDAYVVDRVTTRLCDNADAGIPPEKRMPVFLSEIAFDGYMWNRHAEKLGENGQWRVRFTDFDNLPKGREVHWNSAFAWYLRGLGEIRQAMTGDTLRNSIFRMSIWANPILLVIALGVFATLSARRFGPLCGAVIAIGMVSVPTFYEGFMPAYPDHHGLIAFALLGLLFGIAWAGAGWVQGADGTDLAPPHSLRQARHGMIFSAICGAAGLWFSALSTAIVLGTIGAAILITAMVFARPARKIDSSFNPDLWRTWAKWGAGASLGFYLLEYFPFHMGFRMEVNHPFYALAWLGGGWIIAEVSGWLRKPVAATFPWNKLAWPLAACVALPAVILLGGDSVYIPKDPFMGRLWKNIAELLPLTKRIEMGGLTWQIAMGWFPMFLAAALVLQFSRRVGVGTRAALVFLSIPIVLITSLQFYQVRWGMLVGPLYIALAGIVIPQVWRSVPTGRTSRLVASTMLLACGFLFVAPTIRNFKNNQWTQFRSGNRINLSAGQALALLHRQMARTILDDAGDKPVCLLSSPNSSCLLSALGGFRTVGTLYWENVEGLKAAAAALNAQSDAEALALLKRHGITHVSLMSWENFIGPFFGILYPNPLPGKSYDNSFGKRALFDKVIPAWMRPLIFPPNDLTKGLQQQVFLLRAAPEQDPTEAKFHLARYARLVEGNPVSAEIALKEILDEHPDARPVRLDLAMLCLDQKRYKDMEQHLSKILASGPDTDSLLRAITLAGEGHAAEAVQAAVEAAQSTNPEIQGWARRLIDLLGQTAQ